MKDLSLDSTAHVNVNLGIVDDKYSCARFKLKLFLKSVPCEVLEAVDYAVNRVRIVLKNECSFAQEGDIGFSYVPGFFLDEHSNDPSFPTAFSFSASGGLSRRSIPIGMRNRIGSLWDIANVKDNVLSGCNMVLHRPAPEVSPFTPTVVVSRFIGERRVDGDSIHDSGVIIFPDACAIGNFIWSTRNCSLKDPDFRAVFAATIQGRSLLDLNFHSYSTSESQS